VTVKRFGDIIRELRKWRPLKRQTRAAYGCFVAGQSPVARA